MAATVLQLMPEDRTAESFRFTPAGRRRLAKLALRLGKTKKDALEMAITHALGTLELGDGRFYMTVPSEPQEPSEEETA